MHSGRRSFFQAILLGVSTAVFCAVASGATGIRIGGERKLNFDEDWSFHKGEAAGAEQPGFNDSSWRKLRLPHDWAIEGPFDPKINPDEGSLPYFGTGWYRKRFSLSGQTAGKRYSIVFDGAMSDAHVWLNGKEIGARPYGYISFALNLTPYLEFGGKTNVLAVRLTPKPGSSRWYPGAGLYRNVWLVVTDPVHVARYGTYITTPEASDEKATVAIRTEIQNDRSDAVKVTLETTILDASGKQVASTAALLALAAGGKSGASQRVDVSTPHRWDIDDPYLYSAVSVVKQGQKVVDRVVTPFGIRSVVFDKEKGLLLNGRWLKLHGVCDHHGLGALGTAVNRRATERQLQILKSMGLNAIRTSHNPPSPELLEYCDKLGLMVMDEAFDMWRTPKVPNGLSKFWDEWSETDIRDMVRRDRNHPSVIMWSIGNEIPEQRQADGWKEAERLTRICHEEDPSRPTTAAFDDPLNAIKNGLAAKVDIVGINYKPFWYGRFLKEHPDWIFVGTETAGIASSRGVYHLPLEKYETHPSGQITSYDIIGPPWTYIPDAEFAAQEEFPRVLGEFDWSGFDYLGEPTPFDSKWREGHPGITPRSSYFGIVDLAGFPKDRYYLYQSVWTTKPMVHVLPHWNWPGHEGKDIPVMVYTNADEVELFLNGRSLGRKKRFSEPVTLPVGENLLTNGKFVTKYRLLWQVPYEPGVLKVVAYKDGKQVATDQRVTAGAPARIRLVPDRGKIAADGDDLSFITVRVEDKDGNLCPLADNLVKFKVTGVGTLAAVDNGDATSLASFQADQRKAFSGLALLIVRSERAKAGEIHVTATSEGLRSAQALIVAGR